MPFVNIRHSEGSMSIPASVIGNFAIHESFAYIGKWTITLVSTGLAIRQCIKTKRLALAFARELNALPCEWPQEYVKGMEKRRMKHVTACWKVAKPILDKYDAM